MAATIIGTDGPNELVGTTGPDVISAGAGDDVVAGGSGEDVICGGAGNDEIDGGTQSDRLFGGDDDDIVLAGPGNDLVRGGNGSDTLAGEVGHDDLRTGSGDIGLVDGGAGNDTIVGGSLLDIATFITSPGGVTASLDSGAAIGDGSDTLDGLEGLMGSPFADHLIGGPGLSLLIGAAGDDTLQGGGPNSLSLATYITADGAVSVDLLNGIAADGTSGTDGIDTLIGLVGAIGGPFGDVLRGGSASELLLGQGGNDVLRGGSGDDILSGVAGRDRLYGGSGQDRLSGGKGADRYDGGPGTDTADFSQWGRSVTVDLLLGTSNEGGSDTIIAIENVTGTELSDEILGDATGNALEGGSGRDALSGRGGRDFLHGGPGRDTLNGGKGRDVCLAGETRSACEITSLDGGGPVATIASASPHLAILAAVTGSAGFARRPLAPPRTTPRGSTPGFVQTGTVGAWSIPAARCERGEVTPLIIKAFMPSVEPAYLGAGHPHPVQDVYARPWYYDSNRGWLYGSLWYHAARNVTTQRIDIGSIDWFDGLYANLVAPQQEFWTRVEGSVGLGLAPYDSYQPPTANGEFWVYYQIFWESNASWPYAGEIGTYVTVDSASDFGSSYGPSCAY